MTTKTTAPNLNLSKVADAVHALPPAGLAPEYHAPPADLVPPELRDTLDALVAARATWVACEAERAAAVADEKRAPSEYRQVLADAVAAGRPTSEVVDVRVTSAARVERARDARRAAETHLAAAHRAFTAAVAEHRDLVLTPLEQVLADDLAAVEAAAAALTAARHRLAASRGAVTWARQAEPGDGNRKRPYRDPTA